MAKATSTKTTSHPLFSVSGVRVGEVQEVAAPRGTYFRFLTSKDNKTLYYKADVTRWAHEHSMRVEWTSHAA